MKTGTSDSRKDWFAVGDYKKLPNEVGCNDTTLPEDVAGEMRKLLADYNALPSKTFEDIVAFYVAFERISSLPGRKWPCRPPDPLQRVSEA